VEKVRVQIMLDGASFNILHNFTEENNLKNLSEGVRELLKTYKRLQTVIYNLENAAHQTTKLGKEVEA